MEVMIPLNYWCNLDPRLAIPSVAIPYGQRFIDITINDPLTISIPIPIPRPLSQFD